MFQLGFPYLAENSLILERINYSIKDRFAWNVIGQTYLEETGLEEKTADSAWNVTSKLVDDLLIYTAIAYQFENELLDPHKPLNHVFVGRHKDQIILSACMLYTIWDKLGEGSKDFTKTVLRVFDNNKDRINNLPGIKELLPTDFQEGSPLYQYSEITRLLRALFARESKEAGIMMAQEFIYQGRAYNLKKEDKLKQ